MNKLTQSAPVLSGNEDDNCSLDDYKDTFLDVEDERDHISCRGTVTPLNASTPCLIESRPSSSVGTGYEWEDPWMSNMANSDSCLVSSSSNASPLTGTSSQGISPIDAEHKVFLFEADSKDPEITITSINEALKTEKDFMEYVMSFPVTVQTVLNKAETKKSTIDSSPKVGLDHLDNLCKLMEQLSDLKETNFKLQRRVQYLEDLKTLHEIHKEMVGASTLCNSGASDNEYQRDTHSKMSVSPNRGKSEERRRSPPFFEEDDDSSEFVSGLYRSKTTTEVDSRLEQKRETGHRSRNGELAGKEKVRERSKSVGHPGHPKSKKRSSRWSKVKEVLGIEKQESTSETRNHSEHSVDEASENVNHLMRRAMVEYRGEHNEGKGAETAKNHKETGRPRSVNLSSNSFSKVQSNVLEEKEDDKDEDFECQNTAQKTFSRLEKYDQGSKKFPKTPWGRMKTMITIRRDCRNLKSESSSSSSRGTSEKVVIGGVELTSNGQQSHRRNGRSSRKSSFTLQDVPKKHPHDTKNITYPEVNTEYKDSISNSSQISKQKRLSSEIIRKNDQHDYDSLRMKSVKVKNSRHAEGIEVANDEAEGHTIANSTKSNTEGMLSSKEKIPQSIIGHDVNTELEKDMFTRERKASSISPPLIEHQKNSALPTDFGKDHPSPPGGSFSPQQLDNEISGVKECIPVHPCATATVTELLKELQQNLSDDFNRKLDEWQRFRGTEGIKTQSTEVERKDSFGRFRKFSKPEKKGSTDKASDKTTKHNLNVQKKDLNWLEKELQKVERELLRLSKEKQKFEKRAFRLQRLKDAMTDSHKKNEVLVRTPAGEFRFEGISNAFTKKLYEWETKQGVGPELSTIALLDESLNTPDDQPPPSNRLSITDVDNRSITTSSDQSEKFCYTKSKANSEPDLSTLASAQKDTNGTMQTIRSKSGDTLLANSDESIICSSSKIDIIDDVIIDADDVIIDADDVIIDADDVIIDAQEDHPLKSAELSQNHEDNYYSLLEENMFLLDQLKGKEDICFRLQNELDRLDEKSEKANQNHQEEMETYRQKLWEIHMSRPRDLQGSLQLISELKTRIDELQKCSDKLKTDREKLEQSFRYHSEQQRQLADDLIHRMVELQDVELPAIFNRTGCRRKRQKSFKCDAGSVARIHELSTKLLQQAREMEEALGEKTRQVCHLRWELLHRDMSAVLLQAALHRVTTQGPQASILPAWDMKRIKFKELKAWSIDTTTRRQSEDTTAEDWLQDRLRQLSLAPYNEWTSIEFKPNDLMSTVHELKKETILMSSCRTGDVSDLDIRKKTASCSAESEMADSDRNYDTGSAFNSRSSSLSSGACGGLRGSHSDTRLYERSRSLSISARRNSSSSMSCVSGFDASESSSMHDSDKIHFLGGRGVLHRHRRRRWSSRDNISSSCSSRSSGLEDDANCSHWTRDEITEEGANFDTLSRQLQLKYGVFKETDEENVETGSKDWECQSLLTPKPIHVATGTEGSIKRAGSPHSFLKPFAVNASFPSQVHERSPEHNSVFKTLTYTEDPGYPKKLERSQASDLSYHESMPRNDPSISVIDSILFRKGDRMGDPVSRNSSAYNSAESLDNFKYVTKREQQLFRDIRNLAESCEMNASTNKASAHNDENMSELTLEKNPSDILQEHIACKSPDISQFRYKGTKGFGRTNKTNFRKNVRPDTPPVAGVEVASDRSPDSRYENQFSSNSPSSSTTDQ